MRISLFGNFAIKDRSESLINYALSSFIIFCLVTDSSHRFTRFRVKCTRTRFCPSILFFEFSKAIFSSFLNLSEWNFVPILCSGYSSFFSFPSHGFWHFWEIHPADESFMLFNNFSWCSEINEMRGLLATLRYGFSL